MFPIESYFPQWTLLICNKSKFRRGPMRSSKCHVFLLTKPVSLHLSSKVMKCKGSLNIDGQQFHQHQQKEQPPQTIEHKKTWHMALEIKILALDRHKNVAGLNYLIGYQPIYNTDKF